MVKKPKLSQSLANYTKKQAEKIKEKARFDAIELMNKNRAKKNPNAPRGGDNLVETRDKKNKSSLNENVHCHVWTDSDKLQKRTKLPFHPKNNSVVLLIGEGDFSYCRALVSAFESVQLGLDADEVIAAVVRSGKLSRPLWIHVKLFYVNIVRQVVIWLG